jgi:hypothetical protein
LVSNLGDPGPGTRGGSNTASYRSARARQPRAEHPDRRESSPDRHRASLRADQRFQSATDFAVRRQVAELT